MNFYKNEPYERMVIQSKLAFETLMANYDLELEFRAGLYDMYEPGQDCMSLATIERRPFEMTLNGLPILLPRDNARIQNLDEGEPLLLGMPMSCIPIDELELLSKVTGVEINIVAPNGEPYTNICMDVNLDTGEVMSNNNINDEGDIGFLPPSDDIEPF